MQMTYQMDVQMPTLTVRSFQIDQSEPFFLGQGYRAGEKFPQESCTIQELVRANKIPSTRCGRIDGRFCRGPLYVLGGIQSYMTFDRESFDSIIAQHRGAGFNINDQRLLNRCEELFS